MPQASLAEYAEALDKAGLLTRITEEKRVDELPALMEANPDTAILVEHVKDCPFPFFANGYGARSMYALSLGCDEKKVGLEIARRSEQRFKPEIVEMAPCKDIIIKGDDIDLTMFPLFQHHPKDGQAYLNDTNVVSRDPITNKIDQGIQGPLIGAWKPDAAEKSSRPASGNPFCHTSRTRITVMFYGRGVG